MPFTKHHFGINEKFYVCSNNALHPFARGPGEGATTLVIHSHGDYALANGSVTTPRRLLYQVGQWHAADNAVLPARLNQINNNQEPNNAQVAAANAVVQNNRIYKFDGPGDAGYEAVRTMLGNRNNVDILVVRNRKNFIRQIRRVFLADLFEVLELPGHRYTTIYGSFCRVMEGNPHYREPAPGYRPTWD